MLSCTCRVVSSNYFQILCCENRKYPETVLVFVKPLASLHFYEVMLDDIIYISVTYGPILALPMINRLEYGLDFLRL